MREEERQFLLTTAWLFMRHGRRERARSLFEVLLETDPRDGVAAVAYAENALIVPVTVVESTVKPPFAAEAAALPAADIAELNDGNLLLTASTAFPTA